MKTKDGRRAYGSPPVCDCGNLAVIKYSDALICERCYRIQKKIFTDKNYCGAHSSENSVHDKHGEAHQVHAWRYQKSNTHSSEFE